MDEKILTLHPAGKTGVNISKAKYDQMRTTIISTLQTHGEMTFTQLNDAVGKQLEGSFDGSIGWYFTTVKLDLEARNELMRVPKSSPQLIRLIKE
ncbi:MAG: hypothetical protein DWQ04_07500 [Chloroflexi bacterium]|nr:MAG: hypothetical protein DWQ04_07500 [Chloroflexota bacterium]